MSDANELTTHLRCLLRREQGAMADFLVALADFDRRRLWIGLGYTSLFYFLHRELKLSAGAAFHRKTAAELLQRFPEVVEPVRDGRLCLSSVCELAKVITPENLAEVLPRFFHASKQEAKAVAAEIAPREALPTRAVVTALGPAPGLAKAAGSLPLAPVPQPFTTTPAPGANHAFHPGEIANADAVQHAPPAGPSAPPPGPRSTTEPLTADLRRLHVTVSKRFLEKLEAARDALSHSHRGADLEAILEAGLDLVIERAAKRKGLVAKPRKHAPPVSPAPSSRSPVLAGEEVDSRTIPAAVKREVWIRDGGRCQWPINDGGVCGSTHRLQFDHVIPRAQGGQATVDGIRVLCAHHNILAARQSFGDAWMDRFTRAGRQPSLPAAPA